MTNGIEIGLYQNSDQPGCVAMMSALQEHERELSADRLPGAMMAADHFDYLVEGAKAGGLLLVARSGAEPIGFLVLHRTECDHGDVHLNPEFRTQAEVTDLYVDPDYRGQALAARLMSGAEQWAREQGIKRMGLSVLSGNRGACAFYERQGYSPSTLLYSKDL